MLKKLSIDSLKAELSTITSLLGERTEQDDPIGWYQLSIRKGELEKELSAVEETNEPEAKVGLFFGGRPVYGSKGILAKFAGKALDEYQDLISMRYASQTTGSLGSAGRIPLQEHSQLMITDVARGSFGFILEEIAENHSLIDTPLKAVSEEIAELVYRISLSEDDFFDTMVDAMDDRLLTSLKSFFKVLDDNGATLRIVEGIKEYQLDREDVQRARLRTEVMEISEDKKEAIGRLYFMPAAKKFELHVSDSDEVIKGTFSREFMDNYSENYPDSLDDLLKCVCKIVLSVKIVRERNKTRNSYTLLQAERQ